MHHTLSEITSHFEGVHKRPAKVLIFLEYATPQAYFSQKIVTRRLMPTRDCSFCLRIRDRVLVFDLLSLLSLLGTQEFRTAEIEAEAYVGIERLLVAW